MKKKRLKKKSWVRSALRRPGKLINTRVRLSIGLSLAVLSLALLAQLFGLLPDPHRPTMNARALQVETLALSGTAIYESTRSVRAIERTLQHTVDRCDDIRSIGLRDNRGRLSIDINQHAETWQQPRNDESTDEFMFVPILDGTKQVGQLELCFEPLVSFTSWFKSDAAILAAFLGFCSFLLFNVILYRTLKQLDPRGAVPQQVREALDSLAEGLLIINRDGEIMLANSKFGKLVGTDSDHLVGLDVSQFAWQTESFPWEQAIAEQRSVSDANVQILDVEDELRTFSVSAAPVMGHQGSCRGVMITFDDITSLEEHKRDLIQARQAADRANEAKSVFLSRMSHEIRTPMNAIIGYTDVLRQGVTAQQDQQKYLSTIHSSGEHLLTLINDILDLSKIEAGQMTLENRPCKLVPILAQVIETLNIRATQANLKLNLLIEGHVPDQITADETRLRQVLINIVGNAIKFTQQGTVSLCTRMTDDKQIQFDVADTGIGISEEAIEQIFKPFSQADVSTTRQFGGTGLGLAISKQLSEAMGGGISVKSQINVGTVFTITIDPGCLDAVRWITSADLESESRKPHQQKSQVAKFAKGHVLVVDDSKTNRDLAGVMLRRVGVTFDTAENGQLAIDCIEQTDYDVVFMDMNMPVMDGLTATGKLREAGSTVPIIALTAMVIAEEKQRCLDGGCDGFLAKPIRLESLIETLREHLPMDQPMDQQPVNEPALKPGHESIRELINESIQESTGVTAPVDQEPPISMTPNAIELSPEPAPMDGIEASLSDTLASLGFDHEMLEPAASPTSSAGELVVPPVVRTEMLIDAEDVARIVGEFATTLTHRIGEFAAAWQERDMATLQDLGHWLAGASGTVGYNDFVEPARELEYSDGSDTERIDELIHHLEQLTARIEMPVCVSG